MRLLPTLQKFKHTIITLFFVSVLRKSESPQPLKSLLADYGYQPEQQEALAQLFSYYHIDLNQPCPRHNAHQALIAQTQQCTRLGERGDKSQHNRDLQQLLTPYQEQVVAAAQQAGLISQIMPEAAVSKQPYIGLIPGGLDATVCQRFESFIYHIGQGAQPAVLLAVTGYRQLDVGEAEDCDLPERTEAALMRYRWEQYQQKYSHLRSMLLIIANSPLKEGQSRSNTFDTAEHLTSHYQQLFEQYSQAIVYVEQPFASRFAAIFSLLPVNITIFAPQAAPALPETLYLYADEVARRLYFLSQKQW